MPYPHEHAARFEVPDKFVRFTRVNDKFGKGIDVIFGWKKKSEAGPDGGLSEIQAIRFDSKKFSAKEAKIKAKELMNKSPILFEPATKINESIKSFKRFILEDESPTIPQDLSGEQSPSPEEINKITTEFLQKTKEMLSSRGFKYSEKFIEGDHAEWEMVNEKGDAILLQGQKGAFTYITDLFVISGTTSMPERMETIFNMPDQPLNDKKSGFIKDPSTMSIAEFKTYKKSIDEALKMFNIFGK